MITEPIHRGFLHRVLNLSLPEFKRILREAGFSIEESRQLHFWPVRVALSHFRFPALLTSLGYSAGQQIMRMAGKRFGDYTALRAALIES